MLETQKVSSSEPDFSEEVYEQLYSLLDYEEQIRHVRQGIEILPLTMGVIILSQYISTLNRNKLETFKDELRELKK